MQAGVDYIGVSVGALIFNERGELFLSKRSMKARNEKEKWEAPGGMVHFGETREEAVKREMKEEFGVDLILQEVLQVFDEILPTDKQHWVATTFIAKVEDGQEPKILEPEKCDAIGWFALDSLPKPLSMVTTADVVRYKK